jgi:hypothetical protein
MDSETQPNPTASNLKSSLFKFFVGMALVIGIALLNRDNPQVYSLKFLGVGFFVMMVAFFPFLRLKFWGICALLAIVSASIMAVLTREQSPQVSSSSFLSAVFITFGVLAVASVNQLQLLLHKLGYRATVDYSDATVWYSGGSPHSISDSSWGGRRLWRRWRWWRLRWLNPNPLSIEFEVL